MDHQVAPDYSATVLAAKMCTNSNEHSMHIISPCLRVASSIVFDSEILDSAENKS
jgi:hypothetical protein